MRKVSKFRCLTVLTVCFMLVLTPAVQASRKHGDVENIGNRDINGSVYLIFPNFISFDKEIQLGAQAAAEFEQTARLMDDPVIYEYIDRIGQNIVRHSDAKVPFHIKVVDTDEVNAFALPGGYFYVNKGLIIAAENETELAGVMAHEISHVTARHATERMSKGQILQFAQIPAMIFLGGWTGYAVQQALGLGINLELLGITRESEREADQLGIQYMWNTGYDPNGFVTFFEKLQEMEKKKPGRFAGFFRTHPSTADRIMASLDEQRFLPEKDEYIINTSEFDRVKARLIAVDNAAKDAGAGKNPLEKRRPTLKRKTSTDDPGGDDPGQTKEEKPTLKRDKPTLKRPSDTPENAPTTTVPTSTTPTTTLPPSPNGPGR
jgi:beta-barrel assembly-enhancing protease